MKQAVTAALFLALLTGGGIIIFNDEVRDDISWNWFSFIDSDDGYRNYLEWFPAGKHVADARLKLGNNAPVADPPTADTPRLRTDSGAGAAAAEERARAIIDELEGEPATVHAPVDGAARRTPPVQSNDEEAAWARFKRAGSPTDLRLYRERYPNGSHRAEAETAYRELLIDDRPFLVAIQRGTEEAFESFLRDLPEHKDAEEAQARLTDLRGYPVTSLMDEGLVEVRTRGKSISELVLTARRLTDRELSVLVQAGTFFRSHNSGTQNMVSTGLAKLTLRDDEWHDLTVYVACANRTRAIPRGSDTFDIADAPPNRDLVKVTQALEAAGVGYSVRQAAVWFITDDASWQDLGILQTGQMRFRSITATDAATALRVMDNAGLRIENYRIWNDGATLANGVSDEELKNWLRTRMGLR